MMQLSTRNAGVIVLVCTGALLLARAWGGGSDNNAKCVTNQHIVLSGLTQYLQDWDENFPAMSSPAEFQADVSPYIEHPGRFDCPDTHQLYSPNTALSYLAEAEVGAQGTTYAFKDTVAHTDGKFTVAFLDGHVERGGKDAENVNTECVINAHGVTQSLLLYAQDYDEHLPIYQNSTQFFAEISPYIRDPRRTYCPATGLVYTPNPALSGISLASLVSRDTTYSVKDTAPHPDHKSTVAFMDGHVERGGVDQADPNAECYARVSRLITGMLAYAQDHDLVLPPTQDPASFKAAVYPYVQSDREFLCPVTGKPYLANPALSGQSLGSIPDRGVVEAVKDAVAHSNGVTTTGYLDGYVKQTNRTVNRRVETFERIKNQTVALQMYEQDYDETLPVMHSYQEYKTALLPYVRSSRAFVNPYTGGPFKINYTVSGLSFASFADPAGTEVIRSSKLPPYGHFIIGYLDGHVRRSL